MKTLLNYSKNAIILLLAVLLLMTFSTCQKDDDWSNVSLSIYNTYGQLVNMPVDEIQGIGNHQIELKLSAFHAGIYHYRLLIDEDLIIGKIIKN